MSAVSTTVLTRTYTATPSDGASLGERRAGAGSPTPGGRRQPNAGRAPAAQRRAGPGSPTPGGPRCRSAPAVAPRARGDQVGGDVAQLPVRPLGRSAQDVEGSLGRARLTLHQDPLRLPDEVTRL